MTEVVDRYPHLHGLPDYASALVIELISGPAPDNRDFIRMKFKNGTNDDDFETLNVFGHRGDMALTEFIYRLENAVIDSPYEWSKVCNSGYTYDNWFGANAPGITGGEGQNIFTPDAFGILLGAIAAVVLILGIWMTTMFVKKRREFQKRIKLPAFTDEVIERTDNKRLLI